MVALRPKQKRTSWSPIAVGMTMRSLRAFASVVTLGRGLSGCAASIVFATCSAACNSQLVLTEYFDWIKTADRKSQQAANYDG